MKHLAVLILLGAATILFAVAAFGGKNLIAAGLACVSAALFIGKL